MTAKGSPEPAVQSLWQGLLFCQYAVLAKAQVSPLGFDVFANTAVLAKEGAGRQKWSFQARGFEQSLWFSTLAQRSDHMLKL